MVVKVEKHGYVRYKVLNAIMAAFPLDISIFSVVLFYLSTFPVPWNDPECTISSRLLPLSSTTSMAEEGFFLGLGPWPNVDIDMGFPVFYPPQGCFPISI